MDEFLCVQQLLEDFNHPDNETRKAAEQKYFDLAESNPNQMIAYLIEILGSECSVPAKSQAIIRLRYLIFIDLDESMRLRLQDRVLKTLISSDSYSLRNLIVMFFSDCVSFKHKNLILDMESLRAFFLELLHKEFVLAGKFLLRLYCVERDESIHDAILEAFDNSDGEKLLLVLILELRRCETYAQFRLETLLNEALRLSDEFLGKLFTVLSDLFEQYHKYFEKEELQKLMSLLLLIANDSERKELLRVQCLDILNTIILCSLNGKDILEENRAYVMEVMVTCLSDPNTYPELYSEAELVVKHSIQAMDGFEEDVKRIISTDNIYAASFLMRYIHPPEGLQFALALALNEEEVLRKNAVAILMKYAYRSNVQDPEVSKIVEVACAGIASEWRRDYMRLFAFLAGENCIERDAMISVFTTIFNMAISTEDVELLVFASDIGKYLAEHCPLLDQLLQVGMILLETDIENSLAVIGNCMSGLPPEKRIQVVKQLDLNSYEVLIAPGFKEIIFHMKDNIQPFLSTIFERVHLVAKSQLLVREVPVDTVESKCSDFIYTRVDENYLVFHKEDIKRLTDCLELLEAILLLCKNACKEYIPVIFQIIDNARTKCFNSDVDHSVVRCTIALAELIDSDSKERDMMIKEFIELLDLSHDLGELSMLFGYGGLLQYVQQEDCPNELFVQSVQCVCAKLPVISKLICDLSCDDDYIEGINVEFACQTIEFLPQYIEEAYNRMPDLAFSLFDTYITYIPYFADKEAPFVCRALSAFLWSGWSSKAPISEKQPEILSDLMTLLEGDEVPYLHKTGVLCLSEVARVCDFDENILVAVHNIAMEYDDISADVAAEELGVLLVHFLGKLPSKVSVIEWLRKYAECLLQWHDSLSDPDTAYYRLLKICEPVASDPNVCQEVRSVIKSAIDNQVISENFLEKLSTDEQMFLNGVQT